MQILLFPIYISYFMCFPSSETSFQRPRGLHCHQSGKFCTCQNLLWGMNKPKIWFAYRVPVPWSCHISEWSVYHSVTWVHNHASQFIWHGCLQAEPPPQITWLKDDEPISPWISVINTDGMSQLVIPSSKREDSAIYTIKAKNSVGEASFDIEVRVTGMDEQH